MTHRCNNAVFDRIQNKLDFERAIVQAYVSGKFLTKQIADTYGITPRSVQRIVLRWGSSRSQAEGNRVAAPLSPRHRVRKIVESRRKPGKAKHNKLDQLRHIIIGLMEQQGRNFERCELCGLPIPPGKFEIHHIKYDGATFHDLRIVCKQCNLLPENQHLD